MVASEALQLVINNRHCLDGASTTKQRIKRTFMVLVVLGVSGSCHLDIRCDHAPYHPQGSQLGAMPWRTGLKGGKGAGRGQARERRVNVERGEERLIFFLWNRFVALFDPSLYCC